MFAAGAGAMALASAAIAGLGLAVGELLPVDHAVDEVDRFPVRGQRHQDAAIERIVAALADEFGLEADRRAIGDDLQIMIGEAREQGAARHLGDVADRGVEPAFDAQRAAEEGDRRVRWSREKSSSTLCGPKSSIFAGRCPGSRDRRGRRAGRPSNCRRARACAARRRRSRAAARWRARPRRRPGAPRRRQIPANYPFIGASPAP